LARLPRDARSHRCGARRGGGGAAVSDDFRFTPLLFAPETPALLVPDRPPLVLATEEEIID